MARIGILLAGLWLAAAPAAHAQSYPSKPVRLVNAFAPGGASDVVARNFALKLTDYLGRQVTVENRVGAGGNVASEYVARSPADGYTILMGTLFLATKTVERQVATITRKLGAKNRAHAAAIAVSRRIVDPARASSQALFTK